MTNTNWVTVLGHNLRTAAKCAVGFYEHERARFERARRERASLR